MFFRQETLVLGLEINAKTCGIGEFPARIFKNMHGLCVRNAGKGQFQHIFQTRCKPVVHKLVKKPDILLAAIQHMTHNMAHQAFAQIHEIIKADKGRFRLHHPEFRGMAGRI